jgi:T-complex protein 1 subunit gamma
MILNQNTKRETGKTAQIGNISAAKAVSDIIRTTLGPRSMLKMLLDPLGGVVMTNDGNCILREVDVSHPAAKSMIELSRAQDEEVGDGTTSVIILAGETLGMAEPLLERNFHPTVIVSGYMKALQKSLDVCKEICRTIDINNRNELRELVTSCIGTKFSSRWGNLIVDLAMDAVLKIINKRDDNSTEVDIKRFVRVERIPGGELADCRVLNGVMFNKDVTHAKMRRRIENPRVMLLDCPLEYKKGDSQTNVEIMNEEDFNTLLRQEEEYVEQICAQIVAFKPDIVITEKGVSDLAQHYLLKAGVTAFRRLRKTDNNRVAKATGATIVNRPDEIQESDIGTQCGLFEVRKIGDEYFCFLEDCTDAKACTVLLRGGSKDVLQEIERNLQDAMQVVRNVVFDPRMLPGGGATELAVASALTKSADQLDGLDKFPYLAIANALEVIPRTLAENCGANVIRLLTELRVKQTNEDGHNFGVDGCSGQMADMRKLGIWEPFCVKTQTLKTAIESACLILRIDDVVSGTRRKPMTQE